MEIPGQCAGLTSFAPCPWMLCIGNPLLSIKNGQLQAYDFFVSLLGTRFLSQLSLQVCPVTIRVIAFGKDTRDIGNREPLLIRFPDKWLVFSHWWC